MRHRLLAVLAASIAASYLTAFFLCLVLLIIGQSEGLEELYDLFKFLPLGTLSLIVCGIPLIFLSGVCAVMMRALGLESRPALMSVGAVCGLLFVAVLLSTAMPLDQEGLVLLGVSPLSGAICGWIYWRIAIRQTPADDRPITTP